MTQPPQGPPPGSAGSYPPSPRPADQPPPSSGQVPPGQVAPQYQPPVYPPGQQPIQSRPPKRKSPVLAPVLALIGLVLVAGASLWGMSFMGATIDDAAAAEPTEAPGATDDGAVVTAIATDAPIATDSVDAVASPGAVASPDTVEPTDVPDDVLIGPTAPPIVVEPPSDERADVTGTILFTRLGDIWAASGTNLERLTNSDSVKSDLYPTWSPDGRHIYFTRETKRTTSNSRPGGKYTLFPPDLMRMKADGSDRKKIYDALIRDSRGLWNSTVVQPSVNRNGATVAVVSDGNDGSADEVTLHVINTKTGRMRKVATPTESRLGHNDPAFSPDSTKIAFTYNDNVGNDGNPRIGIFTCQTKANCSIGKVKYLKPGYANPSWSPDGKLLAVEAANGKGRDISIVTTRRGDVRVELTRDGNSFAPVFSPDGDQIAYLKREGMDINLRIMTLDIDERGKISLLDDRPVTSDGLLDGHSTPSWFIPADELTERAPEVDPTDQAADAAAVTEAPAEGTEASQAPAEAASDTSEDAPPPPPGS